MKKILTTTAAIGAAAISLVTTGCFKTESTSAINSDGTSKFHMSMEFNLAPVMSMLGAGGAAQNPLGDNHNLLIQTMRAMDPNVDAWTEAKVETTKLGATKITLGGYTRDFTATGDLKSALASSPDLAEKASDLPDFKMMNSTKDANGNWVISMAGVDEMMTLFSAVQKKAAQDEAFTPGSIDVTEEQIATQMTAIRAQYAQYKPMAAMLLKDVAIISEMEVGGEILEAKGFKKVGPNKVTMTFSGEQIIDMADGLIADDNLPKKISKLTAAFNEGPKSEKVGPALREFITPLLSQIYGGTTAPRIVIKPGSAPAFDYNAEVSKAKAGMSPELKKLVEESRKPAAPAEEGGLPAPAKKAA